MIYVKLLDEGTEVFGSVKATLIKDNIFQINEDSLVYDIKPNYEVFRSASENEAKIILGKGIINSLTVFDEMKDKIKDFDVGKFKKDLDQYFIEKQLI